MISVDPDYFFDPEIELEEAIRELKFGKKLVVEGEQKSDEFLIKKAQEMIKIGKARGNKALYLLGVKTETDQYLQKLKQIYLELANLKS